MQAYKYAGDASKAGEGLARVFYFDLTGNRGIAAVQRTPIYRPSSICRPFLEKRQSTLNGFDFANGSVHANSDRREKSDFTHSFLLEPSLPLEVSNMFIVPNRVVSSTAGSVWPSHCRCLTVME
jgi:hypothetical protein